MVQKLLRLKSATCTLNITSFTEMLYKTGDLNNFSKITDKHKKQTSGGVLLKDNLNNFTKLTEKHLCRSLLFNKVAGWKPKNVRSSHSRCFVKKVFSKRLVFQKRLFIDPLQNRCSWIIHTIHRKKPVLESLFNKVAVLRTCNFIKEDSGTGIFLWNLQTF